MSLDPDKRDAVTLEELEQALPEIDVECRGFVALFPPVGTPGKRPALRNGVNEIFGVRGQSHLARLFQGGQCLNRRQKLHAVVGGHRVTARKLTLHAAIDQHRAPTAAPGISSARTVGINFYMLHRIHLPFFVVASIIQ